MQTCSLRFTQKSSERTVTVNWNLSHYVLENLNLFSSGNFMLDKTIPVIVIKLVHQGKTLRDVEMFQVSLREFS